jgi:hypothetical protein
MDGQARRWTPERVVVIAAIAFGVAAGTYGIANAASGSGSLELAALRRRWPTVRQRASGAPGARSGATRRR